jgi:hypothetical protein
VQILSFGRKQKGSKPAIDRIVDNPEKAAEITKRAELLFSKDLGWAIARAMQLLVPEVLYRCGIEFKASPKRMADVLGQPYRKNIAQHLRVKVGRAGLFLGFSKTRNTIKKRATSRAICVVSYHAPLPAWMPMLTML